MISGMWEGGEQPPTTSTPEISSHDGMISITCTTPGTSIGYKIIRNGMVPDSWDVYTAPFELAVNEALLYQAHRIGFEPSQTQEYTN